MKGEFSGVVGISLLMCLLMLRSSTPAIYSQPEATLFVNPESISCFSVWDYVTINVSIRDVDDLAAYEFFLSRNSTMLTVHDVTIPTPFNESATWNYFGDDIHVNATLPHGYPAVHGDFSLASITLWVRRPGVSNLGLYGVTLLDSAANQMLCNTVNGTVEVYSPCSLRTDKWSYRLGEDVTFIFANVGNRTLTFGGYPAERVFTYPGGEQVWSWIMFPLVWYLQPGQNDTVTWNQLYNYPYNESFVGPGIYVVRDIYGWGLSAFFTIGYNRADFNVDGKVDMTDLMAVVGAFGAYPNHPRWDPLLDINGEGKVDLGDIIIILLNFGQHYP